jgi:hypothetical protein
MKHLVSRIGAMAALAGLILTMLGTPRATASQASGDATGKKEASQPYLGWSTWSLQATRYPGVNTQGRYSWLNEENLLAQIDVMAEDLERYGYEYINIDAGWWMDWDWNPGYDQYARPTTNLERFPSGMDYIARYIQRKGLKMGTYLPVGLEVGAYNGGNSPIWGAPGCTTADIVFDDLRLTNGFGADGTAYAMDFSDPCAQRYIDSLVAMFDDWGVDLVKLDGVSPGSGRDPAVDGDNYDNVADVAAWDRALADTGRDIHLVVSWAMDLDYAEVWQRYTDSWRIAFDVECYCSTMTTWSASSRSIDALEPWVDEAGPQTGWNNLDSLNVGVGAMDGLTEDERRTLFTFWAIAAAPLYLGDDLTRLDDFGRSLVTDREVIAINQLGIPAQPVDTSTDQEVWYIEKRDGSFVVALFNFGDQPATVAADWKDDLGFSKAAQVGDVWTGAKVSGARDGYSTTVPAHGTRLLEVKPAGH